MFMRLIFLLFFAILMTPTIITIRRVMGLKSMKSMGYGMAIIAHGNIPNIRVIGTIRRKALTVDSGLRTFGGVSACLFGSIYRYYSTVGVLRGCFRVEAGFP